MLFDAQMYLANRVINRLPLHMLRLAYYRRILGLQIGPKSHIFMGAWFDCKRNFVMGREVSSTKIAGWTIVAVW